MRCNASAGNKLTVHYPAGPLQQKVPRSRLCRPDKRVSADATPVVELQHYQALTVQNKSVHPVGVRCTRRKSASPRQLIKRIGACRESQRQPEQHSKSDGQCHRSVVCPGSPHETAIPNCEASLLDRLHQQADEAGAYQRLYDPFKLTRLWRIGQPVEHYSRDEPWQKQLNRREQLTKDIAQRPAPSLRKVSKNDSTPPLLDYAA